MYHCRECPAVPQLHGGTAIRAPKSVRDLVGYGTVQMSLRYAHLVPDQRREAVAKLNEKPILALTLRLPWTAFPGYGSN
jgi:hypothetical protein